MTEGEENAYERGHRAAWLSLLRQCLQALEYPEHPSSHRWVVEREEALVQLRLICAEFGNNDWPNELHLADIIENHLARPLREQRDTEGREAANAQP